MEECVRDSVREFGYKIAWESPLSFQCDDSRGEQSRLLPFLAHVQNSNLILNLMVLCILPSMPCHVCNAMADSTMY
jgi:hypothetical protein